MPILRGAVTFSRFRVEPSAKGPPNWKRVLGPGLRGKAFEPLDRQGVDDRAAGWVELENQELSEFGASATFHGEYALFSWRVDEFRIPAAAVKSELERWAKAFEAEQARPPGRKEKQDAKAQIRHEMKGRAPIITRTFDVSLQHQAGQLQIWASSRKTVDEIQDALEQAFSVRLLPMVPALVAEAIGISEKALAPTPLLSLPDTKEVAHGEA